MRSQRSSQSFGFPFFQLNSVQVAIVLPSKIVRTKILETNVLGKAALMCWAAAAAYTKTRDISWDQRRSKIQGLHSSTVSRLFKSYLLISTSDFAATVTYMTARISGSKLQRPAKRTLGNIIWGLLSNSFHGRRDEWSKKLCRDSIPDMPQSQRWDVLPAPTKTKPLSAADGASMLEWPETKYAKGNLGEQKLVLKHSI